MTESENKKPKRPRIHIPSYWLPDQKLILEEKAKECGLSVSSYLVSVGLGYTPKSKFDAEIGIKLMQVKADQARLGNLLKSFMSSDFKHLNNVDHRKEINKILSDITVAEIEIVKLLRTLK
ncbi:hypothetical protein UL135_002681 [Acinetobacter baumannii]|uniref:plasmid mobilization protein n=1 Tax=Acinetobacter TaxID=469 RepID=UPI0013D5D9B2|nr:MULTISPECIES: conjugal transfer protein TraJ [Acinetobacter]ELZ3581715.1 hypothetical protein [Acinetobacter baumannii]ELZ3585853.1 hypothetical protein [Acinetobacter baumannii]MDD2944968.1 hypothetical protein [Acinetobacter sp.]